MEAIKKANKYTGKVVLILCNIVLMLIVALFTVLYSRSAKASQEQIMLDNLCNTVETMKQMPVRYLSGELEAAGNWAAYIEQEPMDEALAYIRSISDQTDCEAHLVDMDTLRGMGYQSCCRKQYRRDLSGIF